MWNLDVPKRAFFYWGGKSLSFLRYMTIYSFKKNNPDWEICFYSPVNTVTEKVWTKKQFENSYKINNYYDSLRFDLGVKTLYFDFRQIGLPNDLNEIYKSDFIRYHLLHKYGGVWVDMDILFTNSLDNLTCNKLCKKHSSYHYFGEDKNDIYGHAIGFLMAESGNTYYGDVFQSAIEAYKYNNKDYQVIGADMLNDKFNPNAIGKYNSYPLEKDSVYSINHIQHELLYKKTDYSLLKDGTVGVHWYGGSEFVEQLTVKVNNGNFKNFNNDGTLMSLIKRDYSNDDFLMKGIYVN